MARLHIFVPSDTPSIVLEPKNTIGRHPRNNIQLLDPSASKEHCSIEFTDQGWSIHDLGSMNGTFINGTRIVGSYLLKHKDVIAIGQSRMQFDDESLPFSVRSWERVVPSSQMQSPITMVSALPVAQEESPARQWLATLCELERKLPEWLQHENDWSGYRTEQHDQVIETLQRSHEDLDVHLRCVYPFEVSQAKPRSFYGPTAIRLISGAVDLTLNHMNAEKAADALLRSNLIHPSTVEFLHSNVQVAIRPLDGVVFWLEISGKPWPTTASHSTPPRLPLSKDRHQEMLQIFRNYYSQ